VVSLFLCKHVLLTRKIRMSSKAEEELDGYCWMSIEY
jgi:hypothetical protein